MKKVIIWVILIFCILWFLWYRNILQPFLISVWNGKIVFTEKFWTLIAIIVALFGKRFNDWLNRPIIEIDFNENSDRCYRTGVLNNDIIQDFGIMTATTRQYFRLRICNMGNSTAKRVRVAIDLYYENMQEAERFEPNYLRWIAGTQEVDIASHETTYVNLLSQVIKIDNPPAQIPNNFFVIRWEISSRIPRAIAWDRESRIFIIKLIVHGDNIKARTYWFRFTPSKAGIFDAGRLTKIAR